MPVIPRLFAISHATILKPTAQVSCQLRKQSQTTVLISFNFLYIPGIHHSTKQELASIRRHRKWSERPAIVRPRYYRKNRDRHHRHRHLHYIDQSFSSFHKQGCFHDFTARSVPQNTILTNIPRPQSLSPRHTHDQVIQCDNESVYQLQSSSEQPSLSTKPSCSTQP